MPTYLGADGARLHYDEVGDPDAPTLVAIAGGAARHPDYLGDLAGLGGTWRLVVPHLRGVGRSPRPVDAARGAAWHQGEDLELLREHLGLEALVLVGHSAGTRLAIAYAAQRPDRVARLLLVTPPTQSLTEVRSDADASADAPRRSDPVVARALDALASGPDTTSEAAFNAWHLVVAPATYAHWGGAEQAHARAARFDLAAAQAYFSVPAPDDLADRLARVTAPTLVVAGGADLLTGVAPLRAMAAVFPNGACAVLDDCGHYPWVEQPDAFRAVVDAFLAPLAATPADDARASFRPRPTDEASQTAAR